MEGETENLEIPSVSGATATTKIKMKKASAKRRLSKDKSESACSDEDGAGRSVKIPKLKVGEMMADVVVKEEDNVSQDGAGVSTSPDGSYISDVIVKDELMIKEEPMSADEDMSHGGPCADLTSTSSYLPTQQSHSSAIESEADSSVCGPPSLELSQLDHVVTTSSLLGEKPYACDFCGYRTGRIHDLKTHMRIHTGEKPHACDICDYRTRHLSHLKTHMRTHTGEKPHVCDICDYRTGYLSYLKTHMRIHTGEKPHACDICEYRTGRLGDLKTHMRTHTDEKPHACGICDYRAGQLSNIKTHMRIHSDEKPHVCDICNYRTIYLGNLKTHMRRTHSADGMGIDPGHMLLILYGSETGTAQDAAERLWRQAAQRGLESRVMAMDDFPITQLLYERLVIFVVATTGQGDPPANMKKSWTFLLRRSLPSNSLSNLSVAVLGLGDSSYVKFNFIAKKLHRRLTDGLGATPLCPTGLADDQHDLGPSAVIDPWSTELWSHIQTKVYPNLNVDPVQEVSHENPLILRWGVTTLTDGSSSSEISAAPPDESAYYVTLTSNLRATPKDHFQDVRILRMKSDVEGMKFSYSPGDVAYITPSNSSEAVDKFFSLFEDSVFHRSTKVKLKQIHKGVAVPVQLSNQTFSLESCVRNYWDLSVIPPRSVFEVMASVCTNELEKEKLMELSSPAGTQELYDYCNRPRRTVLEVLADFPHSRSRLQLDHMFDLMKIVRPRAFSIASSPLETELILLVAVVQYRTRLKSPRLGLCSNWLKNLPVGSQLNVAIKKGSLRFPTFNPNGDSSPVVMVGPGTGVAPFRSYIITESLKEADEEKRLLTLFYGSRNREADFFFSKDWASVHHLNVFTAFSRDQPHKIYVQHIIPDQKELVANHLISGRGHFFVAGSSKDMPEAVRSAVKKCAIEAGRMSDSEADKWLEQMDKENRYQQEVWS